MKVSYEEILKKAESYQKDMTKFLRDMVKIPSESCQEREVVLRIKEEMEKVGFGFFRNRIKTGLHAGRVLRRGLPQPPGHTPCRYGRVG